MSSTERTRIESGQMARRRRSFGQEIRGLVIFLTGAGIILLGVWTGFFRDVGALVGTWYVGYLLHR
jgi:hypothetical protein